MHMCQQSSSSRKINITSKRIRTNQILFEAYDILEGIDHCIITLQRRYKITIKTQHIYSHLDDPAKQKKISSTKGEEILKQHITNTIVRELNDIYNKEAALHHKEDNCPKLQSILNQLF